MIAYRASAMCREPATNGALPAIRSRQVAATLSGVEVREAGGQGVAVGQGVGDVPGEVGHQVVGAGEG